MTLLTSPDPSGHLNISGKILFGAFGVLAGIAGIALAAPTGGSSLVLAAGIIGGIAGMTSGALANCVWCD
ncbi:hypothetical protein OH492_12005 [Vibrio chagasii]|nr:hypothetical protein [Vibrio chagasii]